MNTNTIVTDGELGRLAIKQHELFTRVKKGVLPIDRVLNATQSLIEGRDTNLNLHNYNVWKKIIIGGTNSYDLRLWISMKLQMEDTAKDIMEQKAFRILDDETDVHLIILSPWDFGYIETPTASEFLDSRRLRNWSEQNLRGCVIGLCPAEVGPQLREQYRNQPITEDLVIAMERINNTKGNPSVFRVACTEDGSNLLYGATVVPSSSVYINTQFVFCVYKT